MARIKGYHTNKSEQESGHLVMFGANKGNKLKDNNLIGTEIEIDSFSYKSDEQKLKLANELEKLFKDSKTGLDRATYERDGSLNYGFEIITQPHSPREYWRSIPWKTIMKTIEEHGFSCHDVGTCGLHVHVSRCAFGANEKRQNVRIAKVIEFFRLYQNDIVKFSRREASQLSHWAKIETRGFDEVLEYLNTHDGVHTWRGRYEAINTTNEATIEFRICRGTLNFDSFKGSIDFLVQLVRNSQYIKIDEISNVDLWLKGMSKYALKYLKKRGCFRDYFTRIDIEEGLNFLENSL